MLTPQTAAMSPAERMTKGLCAECAEPLAGLDVESHASTHWNDVMVKHGLSPEGAARMRMMLDYHAAHRTQAQS